MSVTVHDPRLSDPSTKKGRLQREVLAVLREHEAAGELPTNGRFIFYELEQRGVVSKVRTGARRADQDTGDALTHLRETGVIPWAWITDETRALRSTYCESTVAEAAAGLLDVARLNPWDGPQPLIICESRSLGGVLGATADAYACLLAATNGHAGGFLHTELAPVVADVERPVLYLGDFDHQGGQIETNTRGVLERCVGGRLDWRRVAITAEQVRERGLTPISKADNRYRPARVEDAWETEALGQRTVLELVRSELDRLLPEPLERVLERERDQRRAVRHTLGAA